MHKLKPLSKDKLLCNELLFNKSVLKIFLLGYYNSLADSLVITTITGFLMIILIIAGYFIIGFVLLHYCVYSVFILVLFLILIILLWYFNTAEYRIKKVIRAFESDTIRCFYVIVEDKIVTCFGKYFVLVNDNVYVQLDSFIFESCKRKDKLLIFTDKERVLFYATDSFLNQSAYSMPLGSCPVTVSDLIEYCIIYYKSISR